jgi:hypothetical protein
MCMYNSLNGHDVWCGVGPLSTIYSVYSFVLFGVAIVPLSSIWLFFVCSIM